MPALHRTLVVVPLALAALSLLGCGRANPRLKKIEEDREGGLEVTFKHDDAGFLTSVTRQLGESVENARFKWSEELLSSASLTGADEVTLKVTPTLDADDRIIGWSYARDNGDETVAVLTYDDAGRLATFSSEMNNTRNGAQRTASVTWTYQGDVLETVDTSGTERLGTERSSTSSTSTFTFEGGRLSERVDDVGSLRTESTFTYDEDDRLSAIESSLFGAGTVAHSVSELSYDDEGRVSTIERAGLDVQGEKVDPYDVKLSYDEGDARGVDMAPAEIGGLWDLRGRAYTSIDGDAWALRQLFSW